jgi:hypothetical protein
VNRRDTELLDALLLKLTAHFSDPKARSLLITRGEGRAMVTAIRGWRLSMPKTTEVPE